MELPGATYIGTYLRYLEEVPKKPARRRTKAKLPGAFVSTHLCTLPTIPNGSAWWWDPTIEWVKRERNKPTWNGDPIHPHHHQWLVIFDIFIARRYFGNESDHHSYSWSYDAQRPSLVHMRNAGMPACRFYSAVFLLYGAQHT